MTKSNANTRNRLIDITIGTFVFVVIGINIWSFLLAPEPAVHPLTGTVAPDFNLPLASSHEDRLSSLRQHRGKVVLLDFWATFCKPCKKQMPILEELKKEFPDDHFSIISINTDDPRTPKRSATVARFLQQGGYTFPVVLGSGQTLADYKIRRIPTLVIVDQAGVIANTHTGLTSKGELLDAIQQLLNAPDNS